MEVKAVTTNVRMSAQKMREVVRQIQGMNAVQASAVLAVIPRKSARLLAKTLKSAIANSENDEKRGVSASELTVKSAVVDMGPVLKRFKAGARGTAMPRRKKMSHIRIVLSDGKTNS